MVTVCKQAKVMCHKILTAPEHAAATDFIQPTSRDDALDVLVLIQFAFSSCKPADGKLHVAKLHHIHVLRRSQL